MGKDKFSLYHYTSISGLKGIIESSCLHATNIKYLNDSKEFVFGLDYFSKLLPEMISDTEFLKPIFDHLIEHLFKQALDSFRYGKVESNCFVVSFSKNPDVLSQWRAYGKENACYCIKFNYNKLFYPSDFLDGMITKVKYIDPNDLSFARNKLEEIKEEWKAEFFNHIPWLESENHGEYIKMLKRLRELDEQSGDLFKIRLEKNIENYPKFVDISDNKPGWYDAINEFRFFVIDSTLTNIAYSWKHHSFCEEEEYRLVIIRNVIFLETLGKRQIKIKEGKTFLIPYIEIPYDFGGTHIIEEIIVGPCPHPNEAACALQLFLEINLSNTANVVNSKIPVLPDSPWINLHIGVSLTQKQLYVVVGTMTTTANTEEPKFLIDIGKKEVANYKNIIG